MLNECDIEGLGLTTRWLPNDLDLSSRVDLVCKLYDRAGTHQIACRLGHCCPVKIELTRSTGFHCDKLGSCSFRLLIGSVYSKNSRFRSVKNMAQMVSSTFYPMYGFPCRWKPDFRTQEPQWRWSTYGYEIKVDERKKKSLLFTQQPLALKAAPVYSRRPLARYWRLSRWQRHVRRCVIWRRDSFRGSIRIGGCNRKASFKFDVPGQRCCHVLVSGTSCLARLWVTSKIFVSAGRVFSVFLAIACSQPCDPLVINHMQG